MAGTKAGGKIARETNIRKYGEDYYRNIGSMGGKAKVPKGFAVNRELAKKAGALGGKVSSREGIKNGQHRKPKKKFLGIF